MPKVQWLVKLFSFLIKRNHTLILSRNSIETSKQDSQCCCDLIPHQIIIITQKYWQVHHASNSKYKNLQTKIISYYHLWIKRVYLYFYRLLYIRRQIIMEEEHPIEEQMINFGRFSIFLLAKSAQNAYGIKNGDYLRYRKYCSRKIDKIRATMNYKYGNRTRFNKKDITVDKANDKRTLQIALFSAEKYWANASELKFAQSIKQEHKLRARFTAIKKFKRAHQWSQKLLNLCRQRTDANTVSQAEAYGLYLEGLWQFERQDWKKSSSKLIGAREIINDLMQNIDTMSFKVYKQKMDQIDQTIKFCNFKLSKSDKLSVSEIIQIRKGGDPTLSNLLQSLTERRLKEVSLQSQDEIKFGAQRYPIKNKNIILQKSKIDSQIENLESIKEKYSTATTDEKSYEELLNFYGSVILLVDDAIRMVDSQKEDLKNYTKDEIDIFKKVSILFEEIKINLLIDRNHTIFRFSFQSQSKKSAPQTLAKLLSNTTTLYTQLVDLQKQKNEAMSEIEHDKIRKIDAKVFLIRTVRLMFVGQVYFNNQKIKEAYSLWGECERCLASIRNSEEASELFLIDFKTVEETIKSGRLQCILKHYSTVQIPHEKMTNEMKQMKIEEESFGDLSLYKLAQGKQQANLKLYEYQSLQIIDLPGQLQPIPTRPIFYNIFESEINYPSLDSKLKKTQGGWWKKLLGK